MNKAASVYMAVVPAAGSGLRFGGELPKQYLPLLGKPVLRHTLELLHSIEWLQTIVLVHAENDANINTALLAGLDRVRTCTGGRTRTESVLKGLEYLPAGDADWVLVHDAVRPCLTPDDLHKLRNTLTEEDEAGILALPVRDTLKYVQNGIITGTRPREGLWQAQTPQQARLGLLKQALKNSLHDNDVTDEASALETMGVSVRVVSGRPDNIKITYPEDLELASSILLNRGR